MFKKLGKLLKKGAMSVEYIVIGVCVIGMAALATAFVSNKMDIAMGQENNTGDTNAGSDNQDNNSTEDANDDFDYDAFYNKYKVLPGKYYLYDKNFSTNKYEVTNKYIQITKDAKVVFNETDYFEMSSEFGSVSGFGSGNYYYTVSNGEQRTKRAIIRLAGYKDNIYIFEFEETNGTLIFEFRTLNCIKTNAKCE